MAEPLTQVNIRILEKEYQVSCRADERMALLDSAELLNTRMREIRDSGKVVGLDRIAVMAALNMANDLLHAETDGETLDQSASQRLRSIRERVESALQNGQQLEL